MFRYKTYKKSIIMTVLVILLCLVSLTGATLALFTSDPDDGTIGVVATAGDISVDIVDTAGETLVGKALDFQLTSATDKILFEPGATFYTQGFKIKNGDGSIPVKYHLYVSNNTIKDGVGEKAQPIDMETFKETFEIWISTSTENYENGQKLDEFRGTLDVGKTSETYYLFIKMKETVGNEFQGKTYSGIGVTVYAVQGNAE